MTFDETFEKLTGHSPFPWQERLFTEWFKHGEIPPSCNLPTGLGKTNVIAVWLIALANRAKVPRRLVYVVNRRTVVDQTTTEVEKIRDRIEAAGVADMLREVCRLKKDQPALAISTLRGQFADNHEWSANPSRPAVICGTVDMIGSRLLFSGYQIGFKSRPLHAGFLGQDALLVHDEAHLEPAFQELVETIQREQSRCIDFRPLRVMELTATSRTASDTFTLEQDDHDNTTVRKRVEAKKTLQLHPPTDPKKLADKVAELALGYKDSKKAILIFVCTVDDVTKVSDKLHKAKLQVETLTGTLRGKERDGLTKKAVFQRFLPDSDRSGDVECAEGTVYLVCTSAGEVGVNLSADHMVCDLSTFESMAQRFGRVNRFGERDDTCIDVVYPDAFDEKDKRTPARQMTLRLLKQLNGDASLKALAELDAEQRQAAFAPEPTMLPATDILFDAWALTTIREKMPGRPPVEPYLHGLAEWEPPETYIAWREEVGIITGALLDRYPPRDLLDGFPLKPHELLRDTSKRIFNELKKFVEEPNRTAKMSVEQHRKAVERAKNNIKAPVWLVEPTGTVRPSTMGQLLDQGQGTIEHRILVLPPETGGLLGGMLNGTSEEAGDISCGWFDKEGQWQLWGNEAGHPYRIRLWSDDEQYDQKTKGMRRIHSVVFDSPDDESTNHQAWDWYELRALEGGRTAQKPVEFGTHIGDVECWAKRITAGLSLPDDIAEAVLLAAKLHDQGKRREPFQITLGNQCYPDLLLAKSGRRGARLPEPFRHEFASVADATSNAEIQKLSPSIQDLVLHLIAAHHGRARPHFPASEAFDPCRSAAVAEALATEIPRRFARLQRKYGRWGLAYLESLLRAADWAASAEPSAYVEDKS